MKDLSEFTDWELLTELGRRKASIQKPYAPMCKYNYKDCVYDCNYIKHFHLEWYKDLGEPTDCDRCENGSMYDDEDK